jgi:hypothetical protein
MTWVTEVTAKAQICPHIRYCVNEVGVIQNREPPIYVHQNCQGSVCVMAWRWEPRLRISMHADDLPRAGYCGISGKPEV